MLENLDKLDWTKVGVHVYGKPETIPNQIRDLLSDDENVREEALDFLLGGGQDTGNIYDTTAYIVRFLLELLARSETPGRTQILWKLTAVAQNKIYCAGKSTYSVHEARTYVRAIDALDLGAPIYTQLLKVEDVGVREAAAELLGELNGSAETILPQLAERFEIEPDETVKAILVSSMGNLISDVDFRQRGKLTKEYAAFFKHVVENHPVDLVRVAAARASIRVATSRLLTQHKLPDGISPQAVKVLVEAYWQSRDEFEGEELIHLLARLDRDALSDLLSHPDITPEEAHLIVRGILANTFLSGDWAFERYWVCDPRYQGNLDASKRLYKLYSVSTYKVEYEKDILRRIVEADSFWKMPTNLLSFFFGLSDSREELRSLVEKT